MNCLKVDMKFYIVALLGVFLSHQVHGNECDSLAKLTNDDDFNACVLSGTWNKPLLYGEKYDVDMNDDCEWSVEALPKVKRLLESGSDADVIKTQFQDEMCGSLTNADKKQLCIDLAEKYYKRVIVLLFLGVPSERIAGLMGVCNKMGAKCDNAFAVCKDLKSAKLCGKSKQCMQWMWTTPDFTQTVTQYGDNSLMCTECQALVTELQQMLENGATRQEIIDSADNVCERFFSNDECEEYVGEVIGEIMMLLENDVTAEEVCSLLKMCQDTSSLAKKVDCQGDLPTICQNPKDAEACDLVAVCEDVRSYQSSQDSLASISDEVICEGCEALMATVKEYLANDEVVDYIEKEADQLCQYCPEQEQCENAINTYLPQIIALIQNYLQPVEVCKALGLCGQTTSALTNHLLTPDNFRAVIPDDAVRCPDGEDCNDYQTCCSMGSGSYGCCPMPNAVCCSDMVHCCPQGYSCQDNYCVRATNSYDAFEFAFQVDIKEKAVSMSRPRRQVEMEEEQPTGQLPSLQMLMSMGQMFLAQMNSQVSQGACTACKLVMKHRLFEMPLSQEEFSVYVSNLQETVCKEATEQGVECPSLEGVQAIVEAAKESGSDADDVECPIKDLCSGANPLHSLNTQISDVLCMMFEKLMTRLGEEKSWEEMEATVLQWSDVTENPKVKTAIVNGIEKSKLMYGDVDASTKVEIIRQQVYNYVPDLKKCEKSKQ